MFAALAPFLPPVLLVVATRRRDAASPFDVARELARLYPITRAQAAQLVGLGLQLGADPRHLAAVIDFESGGSWDPTVRHPTSGALGLIQWIPPTLRWMRIDGAALQRAGVSGQLRAAGAYWAATRDGRHPDDPRAVPLDTLQSVAMSVFYPPARDWPTDRRFPARIMPGNEAVPTVGAYLARVEQRLARRRADSQRRTRTTQR